MTTVTPLGINPYNNLNKKNNANITKTLSSHRAANDVFSLSSMKKSETNRLSFGALDTITLIKNEKVNTIEKAYEINMERKNYINHIGEASKIYMKDESNITLIEND